MPSVIWKNNMLPWPVEITYSPRRKRLAFLFTRELVLQVRAPYYLKEPQVLAILERYLPKLRKLAQQTKIFPPPQAIQLENGTMFWYLGKKYPLRLTQRLCRFDNGFLVPERDSSANLKVLYKQLAWDILSQVTDIWKERMKLYPVEINIGFARTRWGSCNAKGKITYSWLLIQCPLELIEYVVIHELAHLRELNHSPRFWQVLSRYCPDYAMRRTQLREWGKKFPSW